MSKKVVFNGIEILTNEDDSSARSLLNIVENLINRLESDLDRGDENFQLFINMNFAPDRPIKHSFSATSLSHSGTREKVIKILEKSTHSRKNKLTGTVKVGLQVEDR